jgi:hypothetical protein
MGGAPVGAPLTGRVFWVDSGATSIGADNAWLGYGVSPTKPFLTLDYAIGQCTAGKGDVIYLMPGHAETKAAEGNLCPGWAGVSVIGLATARLPTFTLGTHTGDLLGDRANCSLRNTKIISDLADLAVGLTVARRGRADGRGSTSSTVR